LGDAAAGLVYGLIGCGGPPGPRGGERAVPDGLASRCIGEPPWLWPRRGRCATDARPGGWPATDVGL